LRISTIFLHSVTVTLLHLVLIEISCGFMCQSMMIHDIEFLCIQFHFWNLVSFLFLFKYSMPISLDETVQPTLYNHGEGEIKRKFSTIDFIQGALFGNVTHFLHPLSIFNRKKNSVFIKNVQKNISYFLYATLKKFI